MPTCCLEETDALVASNVERISLFHSEFLFMDRDSLPDEDEQLIHVISEYNK